MCAQLLLFFWRGVFGGGGAGRGVSVDVDDVAGFAGFGLGGLLGGVAEDAVADAFVVAFDAPFFQEGFSFGEVEGFLGAVYPAGAEAEGVGGVHEVAHDEGAVVEAVGGLAVGEDDEDDGGAVEGVGVGAHDGGVEAGEAVAGGAVGDGDDDGGLEAFAGGGVGAGFGDEVDEVGGGEFGAVGADGAPGFEVLDGFVGVHVFGFLVVVAGEGEGGREGEEDDFWFHVGFVFGL